MSKFVKVAVPAVAVATLLVIGNPSSLWAAVPEIDPSSGLSAMAFLVGAVAVIRGFRKR
jgi:hypothetical protein